MSYVFRFQGLFLNDPGCTETCLFGRQDALFDEFPYFGYADFQLNADLFRRKLAAALPFSFFVYRNVMIVAKSANAFWGPSQA